MPMEGCIVKSKFWLAGLGIALALCIGLSFLTLGNSTPAQRAEITSAGKIIRIVDLLLDQEFTVTDANGGSNTITVKDGKIAVTQADCPDSYCMKRGFCNSGREIVCLPHRLVIKFLHEQDIDAMVG